MRRGVGRWTLVTIVVCCLLAVGPAAAPGASAEGLTAEDVVLHVAVEADGDARWRVAYRYRLATQNQSDAFRQLQARIRANPDRYTERFAGGVRSAVARAENATGREMALSNVTVTAAREPIPQGQDRYGTVTYRYSWEGFAAGNGSHLRVGDAIAGFYLGPKSELVVTWPTNYEAVGVVPGADERGDRRLVWEGEMTFADDEPRVHLVRRETGATATESGGTATVAGQTATSGGLPVLPIAVALVAVVGAGAGGFVLLRGRGDDAETEPTDPDLLSPREQVHRVLEDHGGRMKQQELAEACDWHPSKTSKVVSDLQESGAIDVFRLGRENVISLPEEESNED